MALSIRHYRENDEEQINLLYNSLFGTNRTTEQWQWEFVKTAAGMSLIIVATDEAGKIQAHDSFIPTIYYYKNNQLETGKTGDAMITPEYRGKKEFKRITKFCMDEAYKQDFAFLWGIARKEGVGYKMRIKTGYRHILDMKAYFAVLNVRNCTNDIAKFLNFGGLKKTLLNTVFSVLAKRAKRRQKLEVKNKKIEISVVDSFDERFDDLWAHFALKTQMLTIKRSSSYLKWRFQDNPNREYHILTASINGKMIGYMVISVIARSNMNLNIKIGTIADFLVIEKETLVHQAFLDKAMDYWKEKNTDLLICWNQNKSKENRPLLDELKSRGFLNSMGKFDIPIYGKNITQEVPDDILFSADKWFATLAFAGRWA